MTDLSIVIVSLNIKDLSIRAMDELHREAEESYNFLGGNEDGLSTE